MSAYVTDDMVETAARAGYTDRAGVLWGRADDYTKRVERSSVRAALEAVAPLIAAAALREAAGWLDDMARGHRETAYLGAGRDIISRLRARANEMDADRG